jgi:hypothetical protein
MASGVAQVGEHLPCKQSTKFNSQYCWRGRRAKAKAADFYKGLISGQGI